MPAMRKRPNSVAGTRARRRPGMMGRPIPKPRFKIKLGETHVAVHPIKYQFVQNRTFRDEKGRKIIEISAIDRVTKKVIATGHLTTEHVERLKKEIRHLNERYASGKKPKGNWLASAATSPTVMVKVAQFLIEHH